MLQACGGRSDTEDYLYGDDVTVGASSAQGGTPSTGATPGAGATPGTGASSSAGGSRPGTGATGAGASAPVGGSVSEGGGVSTGGSIAMGGVGASAGGVSQAGVAGTGPDVPISCGGQVCDALTQVCCATLGGLGCFPAGESCPGATLLCGTTSDCRDDQVCCLRLIGETNATAQCKDACGGGMGSQAERRLCMDDSECSRNRPHCRDTTFGVKVCTRF